MEHWRLLQSGELADESKGDEVYHPAKEWKRVAGAWCVQDHSRPVRRRCQLAPAPIACAAVLPPLDIPVLGWFPSVSEWRVTLLRGHPHIQTMPYWTSLPPPIATNPDEQAFRAWREREENKSATLKDAWMAALETREK